MRILETRINEVILKGKVGQETSEDEEQAMKLEPEVQKPTVQKSSASPLASNPAKTNLDSTGMGNTGPARHQSVKRAMRVEPETQMATEQTSGLSTKRKRVGASGKEEAAERKANARGFRSKDVE